MKVTIRLTELIIKSLTESMPVEVMVAMVRNLIRNYDIHQRTGYPDSIPIQKMDAATQIVRDIKERNLVPRFAALLVELHLHGHMGRQYPVASIKDILREIKDGGLIYDQEHKMFMEDPAVRRTKNWGALYEGEEYVLALMRLDIAGNSALVRQYPDAVIQSTYADLRGIVQRAIDRRNGRIWSWEGDGGLVAFYFSQKNMRATVSAMEIVHELFIYNQLHCRLQKPLGVRIAVHSGPCQYVADTDDLKNETIKRITEIESKHTKPNTMTVSDVVYSSLDPLFAKQMKPVQTGDRRYLYSYELEWEQ